MKRLFLPLILTMSAVAQTSDGVIQFPGTGVSPHVAWGGGWSTTIYFTISSFNDGASALLTFRFYDATGSPARVPIATTSGITGSVSEVTMTASRDLQAIDLIGTDLNTFTGWVTVRSTAGRVQVYEVFRHSIAGRPDFEAAVPFIQIPPQSSRNFVRFPFDSRNGRESGLAVANPPENHTGSAERRSDSVYIVCFSGGEQLHSGRPEILSGQIVYGARTLSSLVPETSGKKGFCSVEASESEAPAPVVIALSFTPGGAFSTIPVTQPATP